MLTVKSINTLGNQNFIYFISFVSEYSLFQSYGILGTYTMRHNFSHFFNLFLWSNMGKLLIFGREDIDNVTSFRQAYLAWWKMPRELEFMSKQFKDDWGWTSILWCHFSCFNNKRVRLDCATTKFRCLNETVITDDQRNRPILFFN